MITQIYFMTIYRTVNNVMVSGVVNMLKIEITPIIDDNKISSFVLIKLKSFLNCIEYRYLISVVLWCF